MYAHPCKDTSQVVRKRNLLTQLQKTAGDLLEKIQAMPGHAPRGIKSAPSQHTKTLLLRLNRVEVSTALSPNRAPRPCSARRIPCSLRAIDPPALLRTDAFSLVSDMDWKLLDFSCAAFSECKVRPPIAIPTTGRACHASCHGFRAGLSL